MRVARNLIGTVAALIFFFAGMTMLSIRSVSGDSVAEAFYQAFGVFSLGLGAATIAFLLTSFTRDDQRKDPARFKRCIECREVIFKEATRCPECRTDLIAAEASENAARAAGKPSLTDDP